MIIQVLQLVDLEAVLLGFAALLVLTFGGIFGKQIGSSKSPGSLKLRPYRAKQTGSSKSSRLLKPQRGDGTLAQSVTRERRQSRLQGAWAEDPAQKCQPMPSASSGSSGEEPANKSDWRRLRDQRRRRRLASTVTSGDPIKDALVDKIKSFQISGKRRSTSGGFSVRAKRATTETRRATQLMSSSSLSKAIAPPRSSKVNAKIWHFTRAQWRLSRRRRITKRVFETSEL